MPLPPTGPRYRRPWPRTPSLLAATTLAASLASATPGPRLGATTTSPAPESPVRLHGTNGRAVDFAGIWEATPEGIIAVVDASAGLFLVPWDRIDLTRLKADYPALEAARQRALFLRSPQPVNLGVFAGILTQAQAAEELRRILDRPHTLKAPIRQRTTTSVTGVPSTVTLPRPAIYDGILVPPPPPPAPIINHRTITETRFSPEEIVTSPRRVLDALSRSDRVSTADRRELFDLVKTNPAFFEETAVALERLASSLPPRHLLPADSPTANLGPRLMECAYGLRAVVSASNLQNADRDLMRQLLSLAETDPTAPAR